MNDEFFELVKSVKRLEFRIVECEEFQGTKPLELGPEFFIEKKKPDPNKPKIKIIKPIEKKRRKIIAGGNIFAAYHILLNIYHHLKSNKIQVYDLIYLFTQFL